MSIEIRGEYTYRVADACQVLSPDCEKLYRDTAIVKVDGKVVDTGITGIEDKDAIAILRLEPWVSIEAETFFTGTVCEAVNKVTNNATIEDVKSALITVPALMEDDHIIKPDFQRMGWGRYNKFVGGIWPSYDRTDEEWIEI